MTVPTNTFQTYQAKGLREDLTDIIANISPTETPFQMAIGKSKAKATYHEWQTDALAAAVDTNAQIEGDDATILAATPTVRVGNYTQISTKTASVSGTNEIVDKAGRDSEMAYQIAKRLKELKRDMEQQICSNKASVAGSASVARQSAGFESWMVTNVSRGAGGANGGFSGGIVAAPTDGTARAFTETLLKTVIAAAWTAGGEPSLVIVGPSNKQVASGFTGNATRYKDANDKRLVAAIDVYESDFGEFQIVPSRFSRTRSALIVDPSRASVAMLRPVKQWELAKTGDSEKRQILGEYTLRIDNEAAHGIVADLT